MKRLYIFLLIIFNHNSWANTEYFSAPLLTASWKIDNKHSICQLKQNIPLYGVADFTHQSGESLRFSIRETRYKPEIVKASLFVDKPTWIHNTPPTKDYFVTLDKGIDIQDYPRLSVYGDTAEAMMDVLIKGYHPTFVYVRAAIGGLSGETNVAVSAVNFKNKYKQFVDCRKNFLPSGLKDGLEKSLFFRYASKQLDTSGLKQLRETANYLKQIKGSQIIIASNTVLAGKRDMRWFSFRANTIINQLSKLGVSKNKVKVKKEGASSISNKIVQLNVFGPDALKVIYYRKGNTQLTQAEKGRLDLLFRYVSEYQPQQKIVIRSHTDAKGSRANNLKVSQIRGEVIKNYLIAKGLRKDKVQVKAYGESKPAKSNRFPPGRAQNRRVTIDFVG